MARKPAPPTFRLEHAWQLPDLKAVMLARACAAAALDSPSAAHAVIRQDHHGNRPACNHLVEELADIARSPYHESAESCNLML